MVGGGGIFPGNKVQKQEFDGLDKNPTPALTFSDSVDSHAFHHDVRHIAIPVLRTRSSCSIEFPKPLPESTRYHVVIKIFQQCIYPSLAWGGLCLLPLRAPTPGWSVDNLFHMIWLQLSLYLTSVVILEWGGMFWEITSRKYFIAITAYNFVVLHLVSMVAMTAGVFPLPLHVVFQSLPWTPFCLFATYIQLDADTKSTPKFLLNFAKFHVTLLVVTSYFGLCACYLVMTSVTQDYDALAQILVLVAFSATSFLAKRSALRLTRLIVPPHQLDPTRDTVTEMSHNMFYYMELCNELFVMLSFINLKFKAACMVIVLELIPLAFRFVRLTPTFYLICQEYFPWVLRNLRMDQFRLYEARILVIQLFAEFNAMTCFFVLGAIMRFGPNADFFPMRQLCDKEMLPVVGYVGFNLACYTILVIIVRHVAKKRLGVDLLAFAAELATDSYRSMLASSMSCTCFPVYLLLFHSSALSWIDPDAYVKQEDC